MGVFGGSRLSSYLADAAIQVGSGEAAWAISRLALAFLAKYCRFLPSLTNLSLRAGVSGTLRGRLVQRQLHAALRRAASSHLLLRSQISLRLWSSGLLPV